MKNKLKILGEQLSTASRDLKEKIKNELLPKLKNELDKLVKELEKQGEKSKAKTLEDEFKNLQSI